MHSGAGSLVALRIPGPAGSSLPKPDPLAHSHSSVLVLPDSSCFLCGFLPQGSREQRLGSHVRLACLFIFFLIWFVISSQEARPAFSLRSGSEPSDKGHISLCLCWWGPRIPGPRVKITLRPAPCQWLPSFLALRGKKLSKNCVVFFFFLVIQTRSFPGHPVRTRSHGSGGPSRSPAQITGP